MMIAARRSGSAYSKGIVWPVVAAVLLLSGWLGLHASVRPLIMMAGAMTAAALLQRPGLGLPALITAALLIPYQVGTGTEVKLNPAALLVPGLLLLWLLAMLRRGGVRLAPSRTTLPLALFLGAGLLSLGIGNVTWDPAVPRGGNFTLVQLAQWAIFAFSAGAFWLTGNLVGDERTLKRLTDFYLLVAGGLALVRVLPGAGRLFALVDTGAVDRAPFWMLLTAVAGGQLLYERQSSPLRRAGLWAIMLAVFYYSFSLQRELVSNWIGVVAAAGALVWLRFPRLRAPIISLAMLMAVIGILFPAVYGFAGGDAEWQLSGGSRLVLIERVVGVALRNPITGLGPAAYRPYANMQPLFYNGAYWIAPQINSHNNYVDLFAHVGLLGLAFFVWFTWEVGRLGLQLRSRYQEGCAAGYINGMLAAGAGSLVIMALADWVLPFVYNIGFPGFQASVLVWLFLGGLVALENFRGQESGGRGHG